MDVGLILIATVLFLGGVIATLGDRIGMKVGKARLSLFNLRPRQTATVVTVLTGGVISASTLGLLLVTSDRLRRGLFEFEEVQANLSEARVALAETEAAKADIEAALETVTDQRQAAEAELDAVELDLDGAIAARDAAIEREAAAIERETAATEREAEIQSRLTATEAQLSAVSQQSSQLRSDIVRLQQERQALVERQAAIRRQIAQRDSEIAQRNQALAQRDREIAQRETQLSQLEAQQVSLAKQIEQLEAEFIKLRGGSVAVSRNQTLALLVTPQIDTREAATRLVQQALVEANRLALRAVLPDAETDFQIVRISPETVEAVIEQVDDGQVYALRVASSGNYVVGEPCVLERTEPCLEVSLQVRRNRVVYTPGEVIAAISIEPELPDPVLLDRLRTLLLTAQIQASLQDVIILDNPLLPEGRLSEPAVEFLRQVQAYGEPLELAAVATRPIYTTGPLYFDLVALRNGELLFRANL